MHDIRAQRKRIGHIVLKFPINDQKMRLRCEARGKV